MMLALGQQFGQFEIHDELGRGGMAVVYRATDTQSGHEVALKILYDQWMNDDEIVKRFVREAEVISTLSHQHIVPINDYGDVDGRLYLALGFMDGGTLADKFSNPRKVSLKATLRLLKQVAIALDYAHEQGVVHRDLKLQNILLDSDNNVYLTDFGIARLIDSTRLTATGYVAGTPMYMSPEQARGDHVDKATDIYAFSVMAYLMLTGFYPFTADDPIAIIQKHMYEIPPSPSLVNPKLPEAVDAVLLRGLEKDSDNRYETASQMVSALVRALKPRQHGGTSTIIYTTERNPIPSAPATLVMDDNADAKIKAPVASQTQTFASGGNPSFALFGFGVAMLAVLFAIVAMVSASQPDDILPTSAAAMLPTIDPTEVRLQFLAELTATAEYEASLPTETFTPSPTSTPTQTPTQTQTPVPSATITDTPVATPTTETTPIEFFFPESDAQVNLIEGAPMFFGADEEHGQQGILPYRSLLDLYGRDALGDWVEVESRQGFTGWMRVSDMDVYIDVLTLPTTWNEAEFLGLDEIEGEENPEVESVPVEAETVIVEVTVVSDDNSNDNSSGDSGSDNTGTTTTGVIRTRTPTPIPAGEELHAYFKYESWLMRGPNINCEVINDGLQRGWKVEVVERPKFTDEWLYAYVFETGEWGYVETGDLELQFDLSEVPVAEAFDFGCVDENGIAR